MEKIDYTEYIMVYSDNTYTQFIFHKFFTSYIMDIPFKNKITSISFIPKKDYPYIFKDFKNNFYTINVNWTIMESVLKKLIDKAWSYKFVNDANWDDLEEIEEINDPIDRLNAVKNYFGDEDPIIHTRLLIDPCKDNNFPIVIYYGKTISFQNNGYNIKTLIDMIWKEYLKTIRGGK